MGNRHFIYLFYKITFNFNFQKQLMKDILKTRKTILILCLVQSGMIVFGLIVGFIIALFYNPETAFLREKN
jgi:hypothetical protein